MLGTFGGALEARQIDASSGRLTAEVTGEVETEEGVLVIRRIHVAMHLAAPADLRGKVDRVHEMYAYALLSFSHPAQKHPTYLLLDSCTTLGVFLPLTVRRNFFRRRGGLAGVARLLA